MEASPGSPEVVEEDISFSSGGILLQGILTRPAGNTPAPFAVITLHGWGGTRTGPHRFFVTLGRELAARGVPVLRFDHRGRGVSEGSSAETNLDNMIADAVAGIDLLLSRGLAEDIRLVGMCSGGNVAMGAASLRPERVHGLVGISTLPFTAPDRARTLRRLEQCARHYLFRAFQPATWLRLLRGEINLQAAGRTARHSIAENEGDRRLKTSCRDLPAALRALPIPVHLLYGGGDPEGSAALSWYETLAHGARFRLTSSVLARANHNFYAVPWAEWLQQEVARTLFL